jgi:hypothetical protein
MIYPTFIDSRARKVYKYTPLDFLRASIERHIERRSTSDWNIFPKQELSRGRSAKYNPLINEVENPFSLIFRYQIFTMKIKQRPEVNDNKGRIDSKKESRINTPQHFRITERQKS